MDFTEILNKLGVALYRRSMRFYCKGCGRVIGVLHKDRDRRGSWWTGWYCECSNNGLWASLTLSDIESIKGDLLYRSRCGDDRGEPKGEPKVAGGGFDV